MCEQYDLGTLIAATILATILFGLWPAFAKGLSCNELPTADPNLLIATPKDGFPHGAGCYSEDPDNPANCGWKATIKTDRMIGDDRRLVVVNSNHLGGSGAWDYVFVFHCVSGQIKAVFQERFLYGADIEDASANKLVLVVGDWSSKDPTCCPSREKRMVYLWNAKSQSYVLDREDFRPVGK